MINKNLKLLPALVIFYSFKKMLWILHKFEIIDFNLYIKLFDFLKKMSVAVFNVGHARLNISLMDSGMASPLILKGELDKFSLRFLKTKLKKGLSILDVGSHVGFYTSFFKKAIGKSGKIYCFEPDHFNFTLLKKNIDLNKITNTIIENLAVGDKTEFINFYSSTNNFGDHHSYHSNALDGRRFFKRVKAVSLDNYFRNKREKIDLVKIDVQGVEPGVIKGMKDLISKQKHIAIFVELWPPGYIAAGFSPSRFVEQLHKKGLRVSAVTRHGRIIKDVRDYSSLKEILEKDSFMDLYCEK